MAVENAFAQVMIPSNLNPVQVILLVVAAIVVNSL